jgi:hypothetical protein
MSMIFPGMDPYLEEPILWHSFHQAMVVYMAETLQPLLRPRYVAALDERIFVEGPDDRNIYPDVAVKLRPVRGADSKATALLDADTAVDVEVHELEIHESYIKILDLRAGQQIVTVIEVVSPTNKYAGKGRKSYLKKQREVLGSTTHLVEIDLLRTGPHVLAIPEAIPRSRGHYDSLISINRAIQPRRRFQFYAQTLREKLPVIRIPLRDNDEYVQLDIQVLMGRTYDAGAFDAQIRYDRPCRPPLDADDQAWADEQIRAAGVIQSNPQASS